MYKNNRAAFMIDESPILLLNWAICPPSWNAPDLPEDFLCLQEADICLLAIK
jgi:hypothetical protein